MKIRAGVTVLELMFGLTVVALVASIGTATLAVITREWTRRADIEELSREVVVRRTLVEWLEGAHASLGAGGATTGAFQLVDAKRHGRDADVLLFTTSATTPLGTGETTVRLYVDDDDTTPEHGLTAELSSWAGGPAARLQLDTTIASVDVRCLTTLLGGRRWVQSWLSPAVVPLGIELRLRSAAKSGEPLLQLPILVAMEGGR